MPKRPLSDCRSDFPALERTYAGKPIAYLDGPAGSQVPSAVIDSIAGYYRTCNATGHGCFPTSRETDALVMRARNTVAAFLGASGGETISFGASMTALTFSLSHALVREWQAGDEVVVTALDHEANRGPWLRLRDQGIVVREVALQADGHLDADDFERQVTDRTRLVALGSASNALGTVNDMALARRLSSSVGALLLLDAVHYAPHFSIDVGAIDPDFLLCSGYKFYGPRLGILYSRPGLLDRLDPDRLRTQHQEAPQRIETGALHHAAVAGVAAAVEYLASWGEGAALRERIVDALDRIGAHERQVAEHFYQRVRQLPGVTTWGPDFSYPQRAPTVSVTIEGLRAEQAAAQLGDLGLQVWDGHFYALRAMEVLGLAELGGVLRTGVLMYNTVEEVDRLADAIGRLDR